MKRLLIVPPLPPSSPERKKKKSSAMLVNRGSNSTLTSVPYRAVAHKGFIVRREHDTGINRQHCSTNTIVMTGHASQIPTTKKEQLHHPAKELVSGHVRPHIAQRAPSSHQ